MGGVHGPWLDGCVNAASNLSVFSRDSELWPRSLQRNETKILHCLWASSFGIPLFIKIERPCR